jgi:transglutaminase-like putative cysteine protease
MNKKPAMVGIFISALVFVGIFMMLYRKSPSPPIPIKEPVYSIPRQIQYGYTLKNTTNRTIPKADLWVYGPVFQTATQKCVSVTTAKSHKIIKDGLGNQILHFTFENFPPYGTKIVNIQADLILSDTPNILPPQKMNNFLIAEKFIEADHPEILAKAAVLNADTEAETISSIFNWVAGHVQYSGYLSQDRGALYALRNRKGDCTEYAYLFAALGRAQKIPVRTLGGYICKGNKVLKAQGYHNWAEFMENGVWKLSDPQNKVLRDNPSDYIAMRVMGPAGESPMGEYHRFRFEGKGLTVRMN